MIDITSYEIISMFSEIAATISENSLWLSQLDAKPANEDHGAIMTAVFIAMEQKLATLDPVCVSPASAFNIAADIFLKFEDKCAQLYASAFRQAGSVLPHKITIHDGDFDRAFDAIAKDILAHGDTNKHEKSMVDAWSFAIKRYDLVKSNGGNLNDCLSYAADAAHLNTKPFHESKATHDLSFSHTGKMINAEAASAVLMIRSMHCSFKHKFTSASF